MDDSEILTQTDTPPSEAPANDPVSEPEAGEAPDSGDGELDKERVLDALRHVIDPELGINIVELGLVYGVDIQDGRVHVTYTLTTMGCPIGPLIEQQISALLAGVPGVEEVTSEFALRPAWSPEMMSDEAKAALGMF